MVQPKYWFGILSEKGQLEQEIEKELIDRIKNNPAQFGILFDAHYSGIFNYILRRVGDYDRAKDISSETFLKAFLNIGKFKWKGISISFWLYRIAGTEVLQSFRKGKYAPDSLNTLIETTGWDMTDYESTPEKKLQIERELKQDEDFILVQQAIKSFPIVYQEVLALRYFEQKSVKEIAAILDKKEGTVKSLLSRGIEKLRNVL